MFAGSSCCLYLPNCMLTPFFIAAATLPSFHPNPHSPFFPAFQNGLVQDQGVAEAIFAVTDALPGAEIGAALQTVSLLSSSLISEVDMSVFPGFSGTVITSSRLTVSWGWGVTGLGGGIMLHVASG